VYNSLAAVAVGLELEVPFTVIAGALASYTGTQRRFQKRGVAGGIAVYDDYAHHPAEISATLSAVRQGWKGRVIAIFQPHRYSRTRDLLQDFGTAFHNADRVLVCDIYAAGEEQIAGLTGEDVARSITSHGHKGARYTGGCEEAVSQAADELKEGDLLITLGAGDVWKAGEQVLKRLAK
jgi:UDP-N-acetylmuramate--alanine ligase